MQGGSADPTTQIPSQGLCESMGLFTYRCHFS
nr:MAG TPA: hypothetical protein [Caudoviricetes sp.]